MKITLAAVLGFIAASSMVVGAPVTGLEEAALDKRATKINEIRALRDIVDANALIVKRQGPGNNGRGPGGRDEDRPGPGNGRGPGDRPGPNGPPGRPGPPGPPGPPPRPTTTTTTTTTTTSPRPTPTKPGKKGCGHKKGKGKGHDKHDDPRDGSDDEDCPDDDEGSDDEDSDPNNCGGRFIVCPQSYNGIGEPICDRRKCRLRCPPGLREYFANRPELPSFCAE